MTWWRYWMSIVRLAPKMSLSLMQLSKQLAGI
jgi:hypothetical protein